MQQIKQLLLKSPHDYSNILIWVVCYTAFFSFLRCSEFTVPQEHEYDPTVHLSYKDVAVDCRRDPQFIQIHIKQSKTNPFRNGIKLSLARTDNAVLSCVCSFSISSCEGISAWRPILQNKTDPSRDNISVQP